MSKTNARQSRLAQRQQAPDNNREPAALMSRPSRARRQRKDVPRFTYRIDPDLNQAAKDAVAEYAAAGHTVTVSQVIEAWLEAGRQLWLKGRVDIEIQQTRTLRLSRSLPNVASDIEASSHQTRSDTASPLKRRTQ